MSIDSDDNQGIKILDRVAAQALDDGDYLQQLLDDPVTVLRDAGLTVPDDVKVVVHQNSSDTFHLVLPSQLGPGRLPDDDDTDLRNVVNGIHF